MQLSNTLLKNDWVAETRCLDEYAEAALAVGDIQEAFRFFQG